MSYRVKGFASPELLGLYLDEHRGERPMNVVAGHAAGSLIVVFDVREERMAKEKNLKEVPAEADEDDEEEEEEEKPEEPAQPVARQKPDRHPRLPVHGTAKHKVQAKRKR